MRRLFVVPEGFLSQLPFETIELEGGRFLMELVEIVYAQDPVTPRERLERPAPERPPRPRSSPLEAWTTGNAGS